MKKNTGRKIVKYILFIGLSACFLAIFCFSILYITSPVKFDKQKILDTNLSIKIYDPENRPLKHTYLYGDYITLQQLPYLTKQCFLSIEDKYFYTHNGINFKRIAGAMLKNISKFGFVEGASTISQQLIKNTHLTNEKTIKRKVNEIKLTFEMEKNLTKDEILESYLNIIYFGDNCYGIQSASEHYFSKSASKLTLDESAMLAGMIKSPNKYHPVKQYDMCLKRRNLVLNELYEDGFINNEIFQENKNKETKIMLNDASYQTTSYQKACIKEAETILNMPEKQIAIGGYRIYTYYNEEKQIALESSVDYDIKEQMAMISINASNGQIEAYVEKSNIPLINIKRQPASAIKPILVYAPAINENIISPSTQILDQNISINGYEPKNIGNKENGYVDAKYALSHSLNIPAVKILSYVGIQKAQKYLQMQKIEFDKNDNNLALALGGMTHGLTLKELTNCYQTLANNGQFIPAKFINYIVDTNGKVIYKNDSIAKNIYRQDTAFLVTDMLKDGAKNGTAKRLSDLPFELASKTGTSSNIQKNIDAYNISYTSNDVVGCWIGNLDNSPTDIVGGGKPTTCIKTYLSKIYKSKKPKAFNIPSGIIELDVDLNALKNEHVVYKANNFLPERYRQKAYFSRFNMPKTNFNNNLTMIPPQINGKIKNNMAEITFDTNIYNEYEIYMIESNQEQLLSKISNNHGEYTFSIKQHPNRICKYYIKMKSKNYLNGDIVESEKSNVIELFYKQ